jgi:hypothetical protein
MNSAFKRSILTVTIGAAVIGAALLPALAQPAGGGRNPDQPRKQPGDRPAGEPNPGGGGGGAQRRSPWAEKYRDDLRDHPRIARALVALHEVKDYLEKPAPGAGDFGGHQAASIKACEEAIKQLTEAMKHDPKREPGQRRGQDKDRPGDRDDGKDKDKDKDKGKK